MRFVPPSAGEVTAAAVVAAGLLTGVLLLAFSRHRVGRRGGRKLVLMPELESQFRRSVGHGLIIGGLVGPVLDSSRGIALSLPKLLIAVSFLALGILQVVVRPGGCWIAENGLCLYGRFHPWTDVESISIGPRYRYGIRVRIRGRNPFDAEYREPVVEAFRGKNVRIQESGVAGRP